MEVPPLGKLLEKGAVFSAALLDGEASSQEEVPPEENDLELRIVGVAGGIPITLFRGSHHPMERAILRGVFLRNRRSAIEREAILGLYPPPQAMAAEERLRRRQDAHALLKKPEQDLSPEERRTVGVLRYGRARLGMSRVFGSAPRPGPARERLHREALEECMAVCRILGPVAEADPRIDDVGMTFWAARSLAHYYLKAGDTARAVAYAESALGFIKEAGLKDPEESEYRHWQAGGSAMLAEARAGKSLPGTAGDGTR
jgi:hypothetical protein